MPDEEQNRPVERQPTDQHVEREVPSQSDGLREATVSDGELLKATGARPSPNPISGPPTQDGPINKAAGPAEQPLVNDSTPREVLSEERRQIPATPPPSQPKADTTDE